MRQVTKIDFSGQTIFAGIDVHKKSWKVSIRSEHMLHGESRDFEIPRFARNGVTAGFNEGTEVLKRFLPAVGMTGTIF